MSALGQGPRAAAAALFARLFPPGLLGRRFASGIGWSLVGAVASRALNLAGSVACARLMGQAAFGEYGMVLGTVGTLGAFSAMGLGLTATRYVAVYRERDPARVARVLRMSARASTAAGALVAAILALAAPLLADRALGQPALAGPLALGAALVLLNAVISFQNGALAGFEAFRPLARVGLASGLVSLPLVALGAWSAGVKGAILGTAASLAVNAALNARLLRALRPIAPPGPAPADGGEAAVFWTFGLPAFLGTVAVAPSMWACNALLVKAEGGFAGLGLYTAADRWRLALLFVPTTVFRTVLPLLASLRGSDDLAGYRKVNRANLVISLSLVAGPALVLAALSAPVMGAYGPGFRAGWPVLALLALGTIPEALNTVFGYPLVVGDRMWTRFGFDLLLAAALAGLGALLVPRWGAVGLAVAYGASFALTATGLYAMTWRDARRPAEAARRMTYP